MELGDKIRSKRKEQKITQKELADGLCTQAMISRIEKMTVIPSIHLLQNIAERLHTPMEELIGTSSERNQLLVKEVVLHIRKHLERREYDSILYKLELNNELIEKVSGNERLFFDWIEALMQYIDGKDMDRSLRSLKTLTKKTRTGELFIEVICSIGNIYMMDNQYEQAEKYFLSGIKAYNEWMNIEKKVKLLLNYSICLAKQEKFEKSLDYCLQGEKLLVEANNLYLLGDTYFQYAYCLAETNESSEALEYYRKAQMIFEIQGNERYCIMVNAKLDEIESETQK